MISQGMRTTMCEPADADSIVVCQMLGHGDTNETLNTYARLWPDRLDEVMDVMTEHRKRALEKDAENDPGDDLAEGA